MVTHDTQSIYLCNTTNLMETRDVEKTIYELGGLRIASDIPLVGLPVCRNEVDHDVVIRFGAIPDKLASSTAILRDGQFIGRYNGQEVVLDFPAAGRFLVRAGEEITIEPAPFSDLGEVRAYLLGTVFGLLCHQRGITPLHASSVDFVDGCVAFVGPSGVGKSTLVAALTQRGHDFVSDDVCFLQLDSAGNVLVRSGIGCIRLCEDAMNALNYQGPGATREMHGYNKYFIPTISPGSLLACRRLHRVYELHPAPDDVIEVKRLRGTGAVSVLMQNTYRLGLAERLGYKPQAFMTCIAAASNVSVFRLSRPKDLSALEETVEVLEDHLRN